MLRWILVGLLGMWVVGRPAQAQSSAGAADAAVDRSAVRRLPPVGPVPAAGEEEVQAPPAVSIEDIKDIVVEPEPEPETKLWEGSFELGLDGAEGNTEALNFRFGFDAKRKSDLHVLTLDLDYRKKTSRSVETENRAFLDWRIDRLLDSPRWTFFVHGTVDYDEFQAFDIRITLNFGLGYQLVKFENTSFGTSVGAGSSREIGGPDTRFPPEAFFGLDFEHRLGERQKLTAEAKYAPDTTDMRDFRLNGRASWEVLIDKKMNLSLKLSVLDRYDSTPNGVRPNDLDYSAVLLWRF